MELVHSWANEFVKMPAQARVREILDAAGLSVDAIHSGAPLPETVVVGNVRKVWPHPNADRLRLTLVDVGDGAVHQIVCGAPNVKEGQKVPVALAGTTLPNGMRLERAKIRGQESDGMICAEDELGLGKDHTGIIVLSDDAIIGRPAAAYLTGKETVYSVSVTPNRPDALSVIGLAREIAAADGQKLPQVELTKKWSGKSKAKVIVHDKKACSLFAIQHLTNVKIKPSPKWMQDRLIAAGERPINNVVDITNYVLLELGRPLHSFDAQKVAGRSLIVRWAKLGEHLKTLDGVDRKLTKDMLVVADTKGPLALAGVMGGEASGITDQTTEVLLESAVWDKQMIYDTSHALNLVSESSQRFAKGVDREMTLIGLKRAVELMMELADAKPVGAPVILGETDEKRTPVIVGLERMNEHLGTALTAIQAKKFLASIGCEVRGAGKTLQVTIPSWRHDVAIPEDVHEEVARLNGYNNILPTIPLAPGIPIGLPKNNQLVRAVRERLVQLGAYEHVGYAYVPERFVTCHKQQAVRITNPLSKDQEFLRTCLDSGLYALAEKNVKRFEYFRIFEFGTVYRFDNEFIEKEKLAVLAVEKNAVRAVKGMVEIVARALGISLSYDAVHGTKQAVLVNGAKIGSVRVPDSGDYAQYKLPKDIALAVIDLASLLGQVKEVGRVHATAIPVFPPVKRDLAFWVGSSTPYADIEKTIANANKLLTDVELFDVFAKEGKTSYALHLQFSDPSRTLASAEVEKILGSITQSLVQKFRAEIR